MAVLAAALAKPTIDTGTAEAGVWRATMLAEIDRKLVLGVGRQRDRALIGLVFRWHGREWNRLGESGMIVSTEEPALKADRFNQALKSLHWSKDILAELLGCDISLVEAYANGLIEPPPKLSACLEVLAQLHEDLADQMPKSLAGQRYQRPSQSPHGGGVAGKSD